jgi:hypothetical protein
MEIKDAITEDTVAGSPPGSINYLVNMWRAPLIWACGMMIEVCVRPRVYRGLVDKESWPPWETQGCYMLWLCGLCLGNALILIQYSIPTRLVTTIIKKTNLHGMENWALYWTTSKKWKSKRKSRKHPPRRPSNLQSIAKNSNHSSHDRKESSRSSSWIKERERGKDKSNNTTDSYRSVIRHQGNRWTKERNMN